MFLDSALRDMDTSTDVDVSMMLGNLAWVQHSIWGWSFRFKDYSPNEADVKP